MKYCKDRAALLNGYVDETLNMAEAQRLRQHLMGCPGCKAYLKELLAIHNNFPTLDEIEVPEGFTASVMRAVRSDMERRERGEEPPVPTPAQLPPQKRRRPLWKTVAPAAACLALIVALGSQGLLNRDVTDSAAPQPAEAALDMPEAGAAADAAPRINAAVVGQDPSVTNDAADQREDLTQQKTTQSDGGVTAANESAVHDSDAQEPQAYEALTPSQKDLASPGVSPSLFTAGDEQSYFATLTLTQTEAEELLATLTPVSEETDKRAYELDRTAYEQLLADLTAHGVNTAELLERTNADAGGTEAALALVTVVLAP